MGCAASKDSTGAVAVVSSLQKNNGLASKYEV
jgi:hypothetical protein